jgi:hypothetical protein
MTVKNSRRLDILDYCIRAETGFDGSKDIVREFEIKFDESVFDFEITKAPCRHKHYSENEEFYKYINTFDTCE